MNKHSFPWQNGDKVLPCLLQYIQKLKVNSRKQSQGTQRSKRRGFSANPPPPLGSVAKIWDVVVGVTPVPLGGVVGDSQMVKSGEEHEQPYDDDGNGAVWMLDLYGS